MIKIKTLLALLLMLSTANLVAKQSIKVNENTKYSINVLPKKMSVHEKKQRFRDLVVPAVDRVYNELDREYQKTKNELADNNISKRVKKLMSYYNTKDPQELLKRMKPHARSVAIAQAAMESAWLTSRFTQEAINLFGVHSIDKNEPRVQASAASNVYVTKYTSVDEAIRAYYRVLSVGKAFKQFREVKMESNDPYELVKQLDTYSAKGALYGEELASMIKFNRFYEFDTIREKE